MKKTLAMLLCLVMLLGAFGMNATADEMYDFFPTRQAINGYTGEIGAELIIPNEIDGIVVEAIMPTVYRKLDTVETLVFPNQLMAIWENNINELPLLKSVTLPETLQAIGKTVIYKCPALEELVLPASLTFIGENSIRGNENLKVVRFTGLAPVYVHSGVLGNNHAELVVYVPDDQIDAYTAVLPEGLNIQPSGANAVVCDFATSEENFTFDAATGTITGGTLRTPRVIIPATVGGTAVTKIGAEAFKENVYVFSITVPEGVTAIGNSAFSSIACLKHVELPDSVTEIGNTAFYGLSATEFAFPAQLKTIGDKAFAYAYTAEVTLPEGLVSIGTSAFQKNRLEELTLPSTLTTIGDKAFSECEYLVEVTIPASVTYVGAGAFDESDRLEKVVIECDPSIIPADAFNNCKNFKTIIVPSNTDSAVIAALSATGAAVEATGAPYSGAAAPVETPVETPAAAADTEAFYGVWTGDTMEMEGEVYSMADFGMTIQVTINADGTACLFDGEYTEETVWTVTDGVMYIDSMAVSIAADGRLCLSEDGLAMYLVAGEAGAVSTPVEEPVEEPVDVPAVSADAFVGTWVSTSGTLVLNADGTGTYTVGSDSVSDKTWTATEEGCTFTDWMWSGCVGVLEDGGNTLNVEDGWNVFTRGSAEAPAEVNTADFMGVWYNEDGDKLTFFENGEVILEDFFGTGTMGWQVSGGKMMIVTGQWWDSTLTINDGVLNIKDEYYIDYNFTREQPQGGSEAPAGVAGTAEDFIGIWNASTMEMGGEVLDVAAMGMVMDLNIAADGTITMFDGEYSENGTWTLVDGKLNVMGEMELFLAEDGRLCMAEDGAAMYFVRGEGSSAPVGAPVETPAVSGSAVAGEAEDFVGMWFAKSMEMDGESIDLSIIGMTMELNLSANGTATMFDGEMTETCSWTLVDGKADVDGVLLTLMSDGTVVAEDPDGGKIVFTGFAGTWKAVYMSTGMLTGDPRTMGLSSTLTLNGDGTGSIDFPSPEQGTWYHEDGVVRFGESGTLMQLMSGGFLKFGTDIAGYMVFSQDENATWDPSMAQETAAPVTPVIPQAPAATEGDPLSRMERKYISKNYTAYGATFDTSMLGEYSLVFHENGTCDFVMAGMSFPGLSWGMQKVSIGLNEVDAFVINYYGTAFNAILTDTGFDMDFYGTMNLHFVPAE